jgi:hypothetical protein
MRLRELPGEIPVTKMNYVTGHRHQAVPACVFMRLHASACVRLRWGNRLERTQVSQTTTARLYSL